MESKIILPERDMPRQWYNALPDLPKDISAEATAAYIRDVLGGRLPVPTPIALQVAHILHELQHQPTPATSRTAEVSPP